MTVRTYLPTLLFILRKTCKYIATHRSTILRFIGDDHTAQLDAVVTACEILEAIVEAALPPSA